MEDQSIESEALLLDRDSEDNADTANNDAGIENNDDVRSMRSTSTSVGSNISRRSLLTSPTLLILSVTLTLNAIWIQTTSGLFKAYGQTFIRDDHYMASVSSLAAAANCISRIVWGMLADRSSYQLTMCVACTIGACTMWLMPVMPVLASRAVYMFWIPLMFTSVAANYALVPYAVHRCFGASNFGIAYGFCRTNLAFSSVLTALSSQFLLPEVGFNVLFIIIGCVMGVSLLFTLIIKKTKHGARL